MRLSDTVKAYVINLDSATDRWEHVRRVFAGLPFELTRVEAVIGRELRLPLPEFDEETFRRRHGRKTNLGEVACYLSHVKAMRMFLETEDAHALICEDDLYPREGLPAVVARLLAFPDRWNLVRLAGLKLGRPAKVADLGNGYELTIPFHRFKGTGAYLIDRKAARALVDGLLPMWLPYDHALDREWVHGFRTVSVAPFPISQTEEEFQSHIQVATPRRLPASVRWLRTYPYQIRNELMRWAVRLLRVASWKIRPLGR